MVRPDASVSGTYTVLAENKAGKKRFDHHVDFVTKYPLIHLPGMRHADKNLDDFVEEMLEKIPKQPEQALADGADKAAAAAAEAEKGEKDGAEKETAKEDEEAKPEVHEAPQAEEIAEALQAVVEGEAPKPEEGEKKVVEKHKKHKHRSHHKKKASSPKIDADLINDGEDEPVTDDVAPPDTKRKFSTVVHEPYYETETFRMFNSKQSLWFSGKLRDQTVIEGSTMKMVCAVTGPMPIMKWLKNGKPVPWSGTVRNLSGEGLGQVIIEKIQRSDAGVYSCTAKNQFNEVTTEAVVKVIQRSTVPRSDTSKPAFTRVLAESYHIAEDDLVLEAHVRAVPEPKVVWLKDGIEINAAMDDRFDFSIDHDGGYLFRIHKPTAADSALYACEATNEEGKAKVTHKVNFTELERHTHPQFVYHKESFWQPTLRMSIEPELVKESSVPAPEITQAAPHSGGGEANVPASQDSGNAGDQDGSAENGDSSEGAPAGGSGSGGDGNEDGEDGKDVPKDAPEDAPEEEDKVVKKERRPKSSRRKRYEGPFEPLLIRDSVSIPKDFHQLC